MDDGNDPCFTAFALVDGHPFPLCIEVPDIEVDEFAAANPAFKAIYEPWLDFRADTAQWFRISELTYDGFLISKPLRKA